MNEKKSCFREVEQITNVEELYKSKGAPVGEIIVDAVVDYVRKVKSHSAEDVANFLRVDRRLLSGVMKVLVGVSLQEFILQWRVLQAIDLLDDKSLSFEEVAHRCGFKRYKNLIATFQSRLGTTPYAYRNGTVTRHGNYSFNVDAQHRRKVIENAEKLRSSHSDSSPKAE